VANNSSKRKQKQYTTLLSVLACGATPEARKLVKTETGKDAFSEPDLEDKLAQMYADSNSKLDLEKRFAEIHPHKDFILKYCTPPALPVDLAKLNTANTNVVKQVEIITEPTKADTENPTEGRACMCGRCGGFSSADGSAPSSSSVNTQLTIVVLGLVSIFAIAGTIMYLKNSRN
jgi:hypothetical protein